MDGFTGRTLVIATMHQKEQAIAPLVEATLGVTTIVPPNFDSDRFGTFTRDIPRSGSQREAARQKAEAALAMTGATLAIASEGAFFPHPAVPYVACNREIVLCLDQEQGLEVVGEAVSTQTNYAQQTVRSLDEAFTFAERVGFPDHGLVAMLQAHPQPGEPIIKGIRDPSVFTQTVEQLLRQSPQGSIHLETDMRAMHNPSRMRVIAEATQNLLRILGQTCPACNCPGFQCVEQIPGLPCQWCQLPTALIRAERFVCQRCNYQEQRPNALGLTHADPAHCAYCNP
ncbi:DUF6671 family protein [Trichothermofontia sp.]